MKPIKRLKFTARIWKKWLLGIFLGVILAAITATIPGNEGASHTIYIPVVARLFPSPFGVTMYEGVLNEGALHLLRNAGCHWVTYLVRWSDIEPNAPVGGVHTFIWTKYDPEFARLKAAGLEPFVVFSSNPAWTGATERGPVPDLQNLVEVTRALAERYDGDGFQDAPGSPKVNSWSFYFEPDSNVAWGHYGAEYAEMLSLVSPAIHGANPAAKVFNGGLAYYFFEQTGGPFVQNFLPDVLNALGGYPGGILAYLNGVAFHYYRNQYPSIIDKALVLRGIMGSYGVDNLPLSCLETGYTSSTKWGGNETQQAAILTQVFNEGISAGIAPIMWFKVYDNTWAGSADDISLTSAAGLRRLDRSLKPAYYAFKALARP